MKKLLMESITDPLRVFCNILAFLVPYTIYKVNVHLRKYGDPPWKKDEMNEK